MIFLSDTLLSWPLSGPYLNARLMAELVLIQ